MHLVFDTIPPMAPVVVFRKLIGFDELPRGWQPIRVCVDWLGEPLLLVQEGKPPQPPPGSSIEVMCDWLNFPPKAHHVLHRLGTRRDTVTFDQSTGNITLHVQRFKDGWLLADARGGRASIYNDAGRLRGNLDLGDASEDLQTTPQGHIWVSYFDEGVFGNGIGAEGGGLVCFDEAGIPVFKYAEFAEKHSLPLIADCYALNVASSEETWISYYTDFPLVCIKGFALSRAWIEFGCFDKAFAVVNDSVIAPKCYTRVHREPSQLLRCSLLNSGQREAMEAVDDSGEALRSPFRIAARGANLFLQTENALYQMQAGS
jgi:hypothetical protein